MSWISFLNVVKALQVLMFADDTASIGGAFQRLKPNSQKWQDDFEQRKWRPTFTKTKFLFFQIPAANMYINTNDIRVYFNENEADKINPF
jgi:hypothetical protein